jgi:hypothetical protein
MNKDLDLYYTLTSKILRTKGSFGLKEILEENFFSFKSNQRRPKLLHFRSNATAMFGRAKDDSPTEFSFL